MHSRMHIVTSDTEGNVPRTVLIGAVAANAGPAKLGSSLLAFCSSCVTDANRANNICRDKIITRASCITKWDIAAL